VGDHVFSGVRYVDPFWAYLRSKSKVVRNRAEIFWGTPSQFGCTLGSLGQSVAPVKISVISPPEGRDIVYQKVHLVGPISHLNL